jgi:hypothetical protein
MTQRRDSSKKADSLSQTRLVTLPVAVDLIRFEKNLLQMGFFGAHDTRHNPQTTRRIEQMVNREGQKIRVSAEFRASQELGLPSTSDRDKYIAFMRIAMDQKAKRGVLSNPIRFTGYHLLKELGLTDSGANYEDVNRWGQRMSDTTITSEQVIYMAARKKYANKTVHVFRSFTRVGEINEDGSGRIDAFEVMLEDWLLDNLNQGYVVPEDFNAYRYLKRPTAKGIFGYLHLWFHASQGRAIEKDYAELCMLLNIPAYKYLSKIRDTIGAALNELRSIQYISTWDIRPMLSKDGYKLILEPGEEVLDVLALSKRKLLVEENSPSLDSDQERAMAALIDRGISAAKANTLIRKFDPVLILDQIEYCEYLMARDKKGKFHNPAGFVIYTIESNIPVPAAFLSTRTLRQREQVHQAEFDRRFAYDAFIEKKVDEEVALRFAGPAKQERIKHIVQQQVKEDSIFANLRPLPQAQLAERLLWNEVRVSTSLPSFEQWCERQNQIPLF